MSENPSITQTETEKKVGAYPNRWPPGVSGNPNGKPRGWQSPRHRMQFIGENWSIEKIEAAVMDKKIWRKLCAIDGLIIAELNEGLRKKGLLKTGDPAARRYMLDQLMGKAAMTVRHGGAPEHGPIDIRDVACTPEQAYSAYKAARTRAVKMRDEPEPEDAEFSEVKYPGLPPPEEKK